MSQQPPYDPRRPPRAARHRSSVQGPPPGTEPGTGYSPVQPPPTSPRYAYPRPPPRVPTPPTPNTPPFIPAVAHLGTSRNTAPRNVRPDPNIFDPIVEEDSFRPSQRSGRREVDPTRPPTVMFYPSTTTLSSLDTDDVVEPMPFFRTDLPLRTPTRGSNSTRQSLPATQEESRESYGRTVSVASSGVLGVGTIEVDPDTDTSSDDDSSMASSSFEQVMQEVSTVRRGQAQIVRNPSARKSVVPEVRKTPSPPIASSSTTAGSAIAARKDPSPIPRVAPPQPPPRSARRTSRLEASPPPVQLRRLSPAPLQPRPVSSVYSTSSTPGGPLTESSPITPIPNSPYLAVQNSPPPLPRIGLTTSPSSTSSSESLSSTSTSGRIRPRPPRLNMAAVAAVQNRGSLTSLPDLLDRATRLHDVLSTGRTTSMLLSANPEFPMPGRNSRSPARNNSPRGSTLGDIIESFPPPAGSGPGTAESRGSWPLNWPIGRPRPENTDSPLRQTTLGRGIVSERTMNTPSPQRGLFGSFFPKFNAGDRTPTSRLMGDSAGYGKSSDGSRRRRCCGLPFWLCILILILIVMIVVAAVVTPIILIRRKATPAMAVNQSQCQLSQPCQNNGVSVLVNNSTRCACLCAAGFTGAQCQTLDSSCRSIASIEGGPNDTSIGSAIQPLIQVAQQNFSSQFILSPQQIVERFAADNVSCTLQNSLVNLNGSTSADIGFAQVISPSEPSLNATGTAVRLIRTAVWTTTTVTTTLTSTFTTTVPFMVTSQSTWTSFTTRVTTATVTSQLPSSTFVVATRTVVSSPTATGLSSQNLVFGRCVILAVVQESGVASAAAIQQLMESAIDRGVNVIQDTVSGLTIDLLAETVTGLQSD